MISEESLVIDTQEKNLHDIAEKATDLLASLDPDALNPEQFIAWVSLAERIGYSSPAAPLPPIVGWSISTETRNALDDIDANIRAAHIAAKTTFLD